MTSVIRVKRRIDDDPAEALRLSCKKQRQAVQAQASEDEEEHIEKLLSFAATLKSKSEPLASHIQDAIRKSKIHRELHPHSKSFQHTPHKAQRKERRREEIGTASRKNRYRITWSKRAIELSQLDQEEEGQKDESHGAKHHSNTEKDNGSIASSKFDSEEGKENTKTTSQSENNDQLVNKDSEKEETLSPSKILTSNHWQPPNTTKPVVKEDRMFCIFDVESEENELMEQAKAASSAITMNNVPMVKRKAPLAESESEFVYDLYYTHASLDDLDPDSILTVQSLCHDLVQERGEADSDEGDLVYDDDDDSNDESNWRNDYPDEDPHFFENENVDYDYSEGMVDSNVLDDGADLLSHWMDTRCRVGMESDNGDEDGYDKNSCDDSDDLDF